jgi:hypothetical protein
VRRPKSKNETRLDNAGGQLSKLKMSTMRTAFGLPKWWLIASSVIAQHETSLVQLSVLTQLSKTPSIQISSDEDIMLFLIYKAQ